MRTRFQENADSTENPEKPSESPTNQQFLNAACLDFRIRRQLPAGRPVLFLDLIKNHLHRLRRAAQSLRHQRRHLLGKRPLLLNRAALVHFYF